MSYITRMVSLAVEVANENNAKAVKEIEIDIGKASGVESYYMYKYYPEAVKDTILEGSNLVCKDVPVKALCEECNKEYLPSRDNRYLCPFCGGRRAHIIEGRDVLLGNVVIEER
ncbi:MAG: hydrogenase maturation nickel metallochaperone HypA [Butyrivibrio sp.]|nr:hydrogenase maturation nickel metallochaperone HypA [Butyrivibrio sp.]